MTRTALLIAAAAALATPPDASAQDAAAEPQRFVDELPLLTDEERAHTASEGPLRVTTLFRSERGLDMFAREALRIVVGVDAAAGPLGASANPESPEVEIVLAEAPALLKRASVIPEDKAAELKGVQFLANEWFRRGPTPAIAVAPRIHDRTMFGTGLPPVTKRILALATARRLLGVTSDVTQHLRGEELAWMEGRTRHLAQAGLEAAGFSRSLESEPATSSGLVELKQVLGAVPDEDRAQALIDQSQSLRTNLLDWNGDVPLYETGGGMAGMLLAAVDLPDDAPLLDRAQAAVDRLATLEPEWIMEGGAVAAHPYGWHAVATRKRDALVLSAEPIGRDEFTLRTTVKVLSNDLKVSAQADIVVGDEDGDRLLLALNTIEGVYLFRRSGHGQDYEIVGEVSRALVRAAEEVDVSIRYDGEVINVQVGEVKMAPVRLADRKLTGRWGFGAHAGSTALFREITIE